jgi:hypothetical protein
VAVTKIDSAMREDPWERVHWLHRDYAMKFDLLFKAGMFGVGVGACLVYAATRGRARP